MRILIYLSLLSCTAFAADTGQVKGVDFRLVLETKTADAEEFSYIENRNKERIEEKIFLDKISLLPASPIERAFAEPDLQTFDFQVSILLTEDSTKKMAEVSRKYLNRRIALLVDGQVIIAPTMRSEIKDGKLKITGNYTEDEAVQMAKRINNAGQKAPP